MAPCEKILFFGWPLKKENVVYKRNNFKTHFQAHHSIPYQQNPISWYTLPILCSKMNIQILFSFKNNPSAQYIT